MTFLWDCVGCQQPFLVLSAAGRFSIPFGRLKFSNETMGTNVNPVAKRCIGGQQTTDLLILYMVIYVIYTFVQFFYNFSLNYIFTFAISHKFSLCLYSHLCSLSIILVNTIFTFCAFFFTISRCRTPVSKPIATTCPFDRAATASD